jgi:hypothetical protein
MKYTVPSHILSYTEWKRYNIFSYLVHEISFRTGFYLLSKTENRTALKNRIQCVSAIKYVAIFVTPTCDSL